MLARAELRTAETWIFDLDNTLYPPSCNLFAQVHERMGRYICDLLKVDLAQAKLLQRQYFQEHGTTLRGLMTVHAMEPVAFMDFVHDIDLSPVEPSPALGAALDRLPGRKIVFTNGSTAHAERVLARRGVRAQFDAIFDICEAEWVPKPERRSYELLLQRHAIEPRRAVMVEDIARNLAPAAALGLTTVWVPGLAEWAKPADGGGYIDHIVEGELVAWLEEIAGR